MVYSGSVIHSPITTDDCHFPHASNQFYNILPTATETNNMWSIAIMQVVHSGDCQL